MQANSSEVSQRGTKGAFQIAEKVAGEYEVGSGEAD